MPAYGVGAGVVDFFNQQRQDQALAQQQAVQQAYLQIAQQQAAQQAADKKRQLEAQGYAAQYLPQLFAGMQGGGGAQQGLPPPPGTTAGGPQAPPPGQSSQPPGPPQGGFAGMPPSPMGGGGPPGGGMSPPPQAAGAGRSAGPGGPGMLPPYRPMPQAGGSGLQAPPGALPPPPGGGQPPQQPDQPQVPQMSPDQAAQSFMLIARSMQAAGVPAQMQMEALSALQPYYQMIAQEQDRRLQRQHQMQMDLFAGMRATAYGQDVASKTTRREEGHQEKEEGLDILRQRLMMAQQNNANSPPVALTPGGLKVAEELTKAGMPLPGGWSKSGQARGNAILNAMAETEQGGAGSGAVAGGRSEFRAGQTSLNNLQKKSDSLSATMKSFHNNINTWESIADGKTPAIGGQKLSEIQDKLKKMDFSDIKTLNDWQLKVRTAFSDPSAVAYVTAAFAVAMDYSRIMASQGQSAAQVTEGARNEALKLVAAGYNKDARTALIGTLESEASGQQQGISDQLQEARQRQRATAGAAAATSSRPTVTNW